MAPTHIGHGSRLASFRPKSRPILANSVRTGGGRPPVAMPVRRIGGVGAPANRTSRSSGGAGLPPVNDAVAVALDTLDLLQRRAHDVAAAFRANRIQEAKDGLSEIVQSNGKLLRLPTGAARADGPQPTHT